MPGLHSVLSPSAAKRWLSCPPSGRLNERLRNLFGDKSSVYAAEGTKGHSLAELKLLKQSVVSTYDQDTWVSNVDRLTTADATDAIMARTIAATTADASTYEVLVSMSWLSNAERGDLLRVTFATDKSITDKSHSKHEFTLNAEQQKYEQQLYNGYFNAYYEELLSSRAWEKADEAEKAKLLSEMNTDIRAATRLQLSNELNAQGFTSTPKD